MVPPPVVGATPTAVTFAVSATAPPSGWTLAVWPTLIDWILVTSTPTDSWWAPAPTIWTVAVVEFALT